jgi:serine/threonine-protein kinase
VYFAEDRQLGREVALKTLRSDRRNDEKLRERFRLEAFVIGGLEHPGVVPIYSLCVGGDGAPYYAMRFIRGESMAAAIERLHARDGDLPTANGSRRLAYRNLLSRLTTVCRTIAYAHGRGVVHRDIKPDNIMLGPYGETLVVDWGLAKLVPSSVSDAVDPSPCSGISDSSRPAREVTVPSPSGPTELGTIIGTLAYMSPEQALGMHDRVGPASDIYSLGVLLFVLLTGRRPLDGYDFPEFLAATVRGKLPRPRSVRRGVDRGLDAICMKALERRPEDRYASASDMADDIEAYLADEPIQAWREPLSYRVRRFLRRHRSLVFRPG